jgi:putative flippase GtrA
MSLARYPFDAMRDAAALWSDVRRRGLKDAFSEVLRPDAPGTWQFTKYLAIGGLSVPVFLLSCGLFRWVACHLFGASYENHRLFWNLLENAFGFIPTNAFTYSTNKRWVFLPGKHESAKEFVLFTVAAAVSLTVGQIGAWYLITYCSVSDLLVKLGVIVVSTLANFVFRKLVVFHA